MKTSVRRAAAVLAAAIWLLCCTIPTAAAGYYVHDPMENPKAAADIIVDPDAVYGYAPNPASTRLGSFAAYDWSDETFVAVQKQAREDYHESVKELYQMKADMEAEGKTVEEIARAVSTRRNEIRMESYSDDPEGLEQLKQSNLATFGNENGGTPEYFYEKYGSWETVIEKAFSTNAGADAVLGLYDKYYDTYIIDDDPSTQESAAQESTTAESAADADDEAVVQTEAETAAQTATPTETKDETTAVGNRSATSPKTGDPIILLLIPMTAAMIAGVCLIVHNADKIIRSISNIQK